MTQITQNIAIIGGGLSGLSLALALHCHGITCTIYELRDPSFSEGGGLSLTPNALKVLDLLDVYDIIKNEGYQFDKVVIKTENNVKITDYLLGSKKVFGYDALRINRKALLATLRMKVQNKRIPIKYGRKFLRITEETEETVSFEFEDGSSESATLTSHRSRWNPFYSILALISSVDRSTIRFPSSEAEDNYLPCFIAGKLGAFVMIPQSADGNKITAFSHTQYPDTDKAGWDALRSNPEKMLAMQFQHKNQWPDLIQSVMENIDDGTTTAWPYSFMPDLETWMSPRKRVILLGDSAHAIPPASGQGAAQAFEDAYSLSLLLSKLSAYVRFQPAVDWWQNYRRERTKTILEVTQIMNEKRLPRSKQDNTKDGWEAKMEGRGQVLQSWLYVPLMEEDILAWVKTQK